MKPRLRLLGAAAAFVLIMVSGPGFGQDKPVRTVWDGLYTSAQAARGIEFFKNRCAMCHAEDMHGSAGGAPLVGGEFLFVWGGRTAGELLTCMRGSMPLDQPGTLGDQKYADALAAIFQANGFPASATADISADADAIKDVVILRAQPKAGETPKAKSGPSPCTGTPR